MATKIKEISAASITEMYIHYCLEHNENPKSVYLFCKRNGIVEKEFYAYFSSIEAIEKSVFISFHKLTLELMSKSTDSDLLSFREKLLTYYYTFFEILTANRSYVVFALKGDKTRLNGLMKLKEFRSYVKSCITASSQGSLKVKSERSQK